MSFYSKWHFTRYFADDAKKYFRGQRVNNNNKQKRIEQFNIPTTITGRPRSFSSTNATLSRCTCNLLATLADAVSRVRIGMKPILSPTRSTDYRLRFGWRTMRIKDRPCRSACASLLSERRRRGTGWCTSVRRHGRVESRRVGVRTPLRAAPRRTALGSLSHFIANFTPFRSAATWKRRFIRPSNFGEISKRLPFSSPSRNLRLAVFLFDKLFYWCVVFFLEEELWDIRETVFWRIYSRLFIWKIISLMCNFGKTLRYSWNNFLKDL